MIMMITIGLLRGSANFHKAAFVFTDGFALHRVLKLLFSGGGDFTLAFRCPMHLLSPTIIQSLVKSASTYPGNKQ